MSQEVRLPSFKTPLFVQRKCLGVKVTWSLIPRFLGHLTPQCLTRGNFAIQGKISNMLLAKYIIGSHVMSRKFPLVVLSKKKLITTATLQSTVQISLSPNNYHSLRTKTKQHPKSIFSTFWPGFYFYINC